MDTNTILDASFRGIVFDCQGTSDPTKRALAIHEYPYKDGAEIDDMGRRARVFSINAIFWGDAYQQELQTFLDALDLGGEGELVHPVYGSHMVMVQDFDPRHEADLPDSCTVAITFVESGLHTPFFNVPETAKGKAQGAADAVMSALEEAQAAFGAGLDAWVKDFLAGNPATNALASVADILRDGAHMLDDVIGMVDTAIAYLDFPRAFVGELENVYAKVNKVAGLGDGLVDRFTGWQRLSGFCKAISAVGKTGAKTYATAPAKASVTPPTVQEVAEDTALIHAITPSKPESKPLVQPDPLLVEAVPATPEGEATALVSVGHAIAQAKEVTGTVCDILSEESEAPTLNPAEIEVMVSNARMRIQDSMALARVSLPPHRLRPVTESLRNAAEKVQDLGAAVINARPPLIAYTLETGGNAHLLAHRLYGDHSRAVELLRLNPGVINPNFLQRGQRISIYAK